MIFQKWEEVQNSSYPYSGITQTNFFSFYPFHLHHPKSCPSQGDFGDYGGGDDYGGGFDDGGGFDGGDFGGGDMDFGGDF